MNYNSINLISQNLLAYSNEKCSVCSKKYTDDTFLQCLQTAKPLYYKVIGTDIKLFCGPDCSLKDHQMNNLQKPGA